MRLKLLRKKLGLSQKEMAAQLNIPFTMISKYENGKIKPGYDMLIKIALHYKVNLNWLLLGIGNMFIDHIETSQKLLENNSFFINSTLEDYYYLFEKIFNLSLIEEFLTFFINFIKAKNGNKKALKFLQDLVKELES